MSNSDNKPSEIDATDFEAIAKANEAKKKKLERERAEANRKLLSTLKLKGKS